MIVVWNDVHGHVVEQLTNNFTLVASSIASIYKARWNSEIFSRKLKKSYTNQKLYRDFL